MLHVKKNDNHNNNNNYNERMRRLQSDQKIIISRAATETISVLKLYINIIFKPTISRSMCSLTR